MNKKTETKINKIIEERTQSREALQRRIETAKADIVKAEREMEKATASDNEAEFIKQSDKKRFSESVIDTCTQRINDLKKSISEKDYEQIAAEIQDDIKKEIAAAEKRAANIFSELYQLASNLEKEINDGNQLAKKWANENGKESIPVFYTAMNSDLMYMNAEIKKRKSIADRCGNQAAIYSKIQIVDANH